MLLLLGLHHPQALGLPSNDCWFDHKKSTQHCAPLCPILNICLDKVRILHAHDMAGEQ